MVAGKYDLNIDQGAEFKLQLTVRQGDGTAFDLSTFTPKSKIRLTYAGTLVAEFTCSVLDPQGGIMLLALTAVQTALLTDTEYVWDITITDNAQVIRLLGGIVNVTPQVTREEPQS